MSVYAIGDIQGCYDPLQRLLESLRFDPARDTLWIAGDLVNRGPASLQTLHFLRSLGESAVCVLGNHDFHLLALHYGIRERRGKDSTLDQVLDADDADDLIDWLRERPLLHHDAALNCVMVHAGLHPQWSLAEAEQLATDVQSLLRSPRPAAALAQLYGDTNGSWAQLRHSPERLRYAVNCFTRMRYCAADGSPDYRCDAVPGSQPATLLPWFDVPERNSQRHEIVFGHWAALGLHQQPGIHALDSGCVWGNCLTAARLPDFQITSVDCP